MLAQSKPILADRYGVTHLALVTEKALRAEIRPIVQKEAIHV